jgi:hypothetical protein
LKPGQPAEIQSTPLEEAKCGREGEQQRQPCRGATKTKPRQRLRSIARGMPGRRDGRQSDRSFSLSGGHQSSCEDASPAGHRRGDGVKRSAGDPASDHGSCPERAVVPP